MKDPLRAALRISVITIVWSCLAGAASIVVGAAASSLALVGSGASLLVDVSSSSVLVWRFRQPSGHPTAEHRARLAAAIALAVLAVLLGVAATYRLLNGLEAHPTTAATTLAVLAVVTLPLLAIGKYVIAAEVPSRALRTDAHITVVGAVTALLSLAGLALTDAGFGAADPIAALIVAVVAGAVAILELRQSTD